tara:strand:+ start:1231 stop:2382 length:1152 start_codon:yes stop_codon:yes gene_type:complete
MECPFSGSAEAKHLDQNLFAEPPPLTTRDEVLAEARTWLDQFGQEGGAVAPDRWARIEQEVRDRGIWEMSFDELAWSARLAWRNNTRCVGRLFWKALVVRDCRQLGSAEEIAGACFEHLERADNGGKVRPMVTIFAPLAPGEQGIEILNHQLARYAGYRRRDGTVVGEPESLALTQLAQSLGWKGSGEAFDLLPLMIRMPGGEIELFPLPSRCVREVELVHPELPWFQSLGLRWYSVPAISNMRMQAGGLNFDLAPFSGWYMSTEIGARNFADRDRYNMLPVIADRLGLDTSSPRNLWQERALIELNTAVLHSFSEAGVTLVDHHTASEEFVRFVKAEEAQGRPVFANRDWIIPPMAPARCPTWTMDFSNHHVTPNFFYRIPQ